MMRRFHAACLAAVLMLTAVPCLRSENGPSVDDILARMDSSERNVKTLEFDFTQEIVYTLTKEKQMNSGHVVFQKPDSIHMTQRKPLEQSIISDGKKVWIYTPSYRQVLVDSWKKWSSNSLVPPSMLNFGSSTADLKKRYAISYAGDEGAAHILLMTPLKQEAWRVKLWIDKGQLVPVKASITGENVTITTDIQSYAVNPKIDKGMFTFRAPAGVDVLTLP